MEFRLQHIMSANQNAKQTMKDQSISFEILHLFVYCFRRGCHRCSCRRRRHRRRHRLSLAWYSMWIRKFHSDKCDFYVNFIVYTNLDRLHALFSLPHNIPSPRYFFRADPILSRCLFTCWLINQCISLKKYSVKFKQVNNIRKKQPCTERKRQQRRHRQWNKMNIREKINNNLTETYACKVLYMYM